MSKEEEDRPTKAQNTTDNNDDGWLKDLEGRRYLSIKVAGKETKKGNEK